MAWRRASPSQTPVPRRRSHGVSQGIPVRAPSLLSHPSEAEPQRQPVTLEDRVDQALRVRREQHVLMQMQAAMVCSCDVAAPFLTGGGGGGRAPFNDSAPLPPPPALPRPPHPSNPLKGWAKFSSGPSANQNFSLAPLAPISLDLILASVPSAPLKPQNRAWGGGGGRAGNDTSRSTGRSGRQKAATRRSAQRED